jgi:hypothetical protein
VLQFLALLDPLTATAASACVAISVSIFAALFLKFLVVFIHRQGTIPLHKTVLAVIIVFIVSVVAAVNPNQYEYCTVLYITLRTQRY